MTSAIELIENPELDITPLTAHTSSQKGYSSDELAHYRIGENDIRNLFIKIVGFGNLGQSVRTNLRSVILDAEFEDSLEQTPTFTLTVHDPDWELLNTGALSQAIDINPGYLKDRWYRLDSWDVNNDDITLVFATRNAVILSMHKKPYKINRNKVTRAQFIQTLLHHVKIVKIPYFSPQLTKKQKIEKTNSTSDRTKSRNRDPGFTASDTITVKNQIATGPQRNLIEQVIEAGVDAKAPGLVIVSAVMCVIQESTASNKPQPPNPPYVGAFQQNRAMGWPATGNAYKDARGYYKAAIPRFNRNPDIDLGIFVQAVQGASAALNPLNSGYAQKTDRWRAEAQHAVNAYGGVDVNDPGGSTTQEFNRKYEFMVGPPDGPEDENYLAATYRLAEQVAWRAFWVKNSLHFQSEEELFKAKSKIALMRYRNGIETIRFGFDSQKEIQNMTLGVRMERWVAPCGTVVTLENAGRASGRWLVSSIRRSMFSALGEIVLKKPDKKKLEPANEVGTRTVKAGSASPGTQGTGDIYTEGKKISDLHLPYLWGGGHGVDLGGLNAKQAGGLDCSSFVSLVLYRAGLFEGRNIALIASMARNSSSFALYGKEGRGVEWTVWYNEEHVFLQSETEHWRIDTSPQGTDSNKRSGPQLRPDWRSTAGFFPRHLGAGRHDVAPTPPIDHRLP